MFKQEFGLFPLSDCSDIDGFNELGFKVSSLGDFGNAATLLAIFLTGYIKDKIIFSGTTKYKNWERMAKQHEDANWDFIKAPMIQSGYQRSRREERIQSSRKLLQKKLAHF